MAREARALSDPVGCLKKFDVAMEAGGATVVLAAEDKSVLADDSADFTAAVLDFTCIFVLEKHGGDRRKSTKIFTSAQQAKLLASDAPIPAMLKSDLLVFPLWSKYGLAANFTSNHAQDIAIKMSISDQAGGSGEVSGRQHAVEARQEESDDEEFEEAEGDQETVGAGEGDGDGKDGEKRGRNVAAAAATQKAAVDTHDRTAAAKTAKTKTSSAQEPSAPHAEAQPAAGANVGVGPGTRDTGDEDSNVPRHTLSELLTWPVLTLAHEVVRLEGALDDSIQAQYDADHALKLQRNRIRGLLNDLQVQKDNLDAAITKTGKIATRFQEAEEKWARTVEGLVQELRVERGSAIVQREAADVDFGGGGANALRDRPVGKDGDVRGRCSDRRGPWMWKHEDGHRTLAHGTCGSNWELGSWREEATRDTDTPFTLAAPQEGEGLVRATGGPRTWPREFGSEVQDRGCACQEDLGDRGAEEIPDANAEAMEAMQQWLSMVQHTEKADAKGSAKGKEKEDPKWGVGIRKNSRGLFTLELHHSCRWYFGSHAKLPAVRFLCAVAQMVWNQQIPEDKLVLTDEEEEEWTPDLDVARVLHPGVFAVLYLRGACASPERTLKDENTEASDKVAFSAAVGLETLADESPAKGKKSVPAGAGGVAFVCAVSWMECKGFDRKTAEASAKQAALLAGANNLTVVLYLAVWKHIVTAATKGHDAAKIELKVAKYFENAKKVAITKDEKSIIHEQVDVLRTWSFDPDAAKKMRALGLYIECDDDRAKAKNRDVSRSRVKKTATKSDEEEGGSQPIVDLDDEDPEDS
ncbi:unnamed protein product [Closterium sp. Yama58-4]|nr:unnamed protein product [Closterium sp. Yama58-4]